MAFRQITRAWRGLQLNNAARHWQSYWKAINADTRQSKYIEMTDIYVIIINNSTTVFPIFQEAYLSHFKIS
jgi:hypothetical protein